MSPALAVSHNHPIAWGRRDGRQPAAERILSAIALDSLRNKLGRHADGGGLYLEVGKTGSASCLVWMQSSGRRRDIGLGSLDKLSLADARDARDTVRTQFHAGVDPVAASKRSAGVPTFSDAAKAVYAALKPAWSCGKHNHQWIRSLETYAFPTLGEVPVNLIDRRAILDVLVPIWVQKNETARRVRQRVRAVLDWAYANEYRDSEAPSVKVLQKGLQRVTAEKGHFEAMADAVVPSFVARPRQRDGLGALALEVAILTATRSGKIFGATWNKIDLDRAL